MFVPVFQNKILRNFHFLILVLLSSLPVLYTWDLLAIGGDVVMPFDSDGVQRFLYQWINVHNGQYFSINYYPLYAFYRLSELLDLSIYHASSLLLFALNIVGAMGTYKLSRLFYTTEKTYLYTIPTSFYLLSPALFNAWHYLIIYACIPWFLYIVFRIIKNNTITAKDVLWLSVILFFSSVELPNPKYLFYLGVVLLCIVGCSVLLKLIQANFFINNWKQMAILGLSSLYLFLTLGYFALQYSPEHYGVYTRGGNKGVGEIFDYKVATVDRMFTLHHEGVALTTEDKEKYNKNPLVGLLSYVFIFFIIAFHFRRTRNNVRHDFSYRYESLLLILICVFLLLAIGPNLPFGSIYQYIVLRFPILAFLRTTAGAVFFLSVLYAISLFVAVNNIKQKQGTITCLILFSIAAVGYPFLNGSYFKNLKIVNPYTDTTKHGFTIPQEYFDLKDTIDSQKLDANVFHTKSDLSYINTSWGYFGPNFYNYLYTSYNIGFKSIYSSLPYHNVGFLLQDNSLFEFATSDHVRQSMEEETKTRAGFLDFLPLPRKDFLPHFYIPLIVTFSDDASSSLSSDGVVRTATYAGPQHARVSELNATEHFSRFRGLLMELRHRKSELSGVAVGIATLKNEMQAGQQKLSWRDRLRYQKEIEEKITQANILQNSIAVLDQAALMQEKESEPILEYRKINPTKYRIRVHRARANFPLVFSEKYHKDWKMYVHQTAPTGLLLPAQGGAAALSTYKVFDGNKDDQATQGEVEQFLNQGIISTLGTGASRVAKHFRWERGKRSLDYIEPYTIDFISKNFQGTIQNDNLPKGRIWETWFQKSFTEKNHVIVNGYANSWVLDVGEICTVQHRKGESACVSNSDGTHDFELIVEFWPQQLFYLGVLISGMTLLSCVGYVMYDWHRKYAKA